MSGDTGLQRPASPIADLSYRNYDGPLMKPDLRWWVISKQMILRSIGLRSLWIVAMLSGWYFVVMIVIQFFMEQMSSANPAAQQGFKAYLGGIVWRDQFVHGFSYSQNLLMVAALLLGAGAIANDNRANALLVYLSKPCTKLDYVLGKWVGVFIPMLVVALVPSLVFYAYGVLSFRENGFISQDPWLLPHILVLAPLAAALQTSLILAFSSMFKQGWVAGACYAGLYFIPYSFTALMQLVWMMNRDNHQSMSTVQNLFYCSIDGIQIGLAKSLLHMSGSAPYGLPKPGGDPSYIPGIGVWPCLAVVVLLTIGSIGLMWRRVRAVEVVG